MDYFLTDSIYSLRTLLE
jgi:hypothetical protein